MKSKFFIICLLLCHALLAVAIPAKQGVRLCRQVDGSLVELYLEGDEVYHYWVDKQGIIWDKSADGFYSTGVLQSEANIEKQRAMSKIRTTVRLQSESQTKIRKTIGVPATPARGLCILVNFSDLCFQTENTLQEFSDLFNSERYTYNGATGSVREYFIAQSDSNYIPQFDVVGPVTLDHEMSYYGTPKEGQTGSGSDRYIADFVLEACEKADSEVDFSLYDNDKDGYLDFVYFIYAGKGEADGGEENSIWPLSWDYFSALSLGYTNRSDYYWSGYLYSLPKFDGKYLRSFAYSAELNGKGDRSGIGTPTHEFSHLLGLPDYYDTKYGTNYKQKLTPRYWSLMDLGAYNNEGRTPPNYSAHDKYFIGWTTPKLLNSAENVQLSADQKSYRMITADNTSATAQSEKKVWYIENRLRTGWDSYLPATGLVVWTVDYSAEQWKANTPNNTANNPRYTVSQEVGDLQITDVTFTEDSVLCFKYAGGKIEQAVYSVTYDLDNARLVVGDEEIKSGETLVAVIVAESGYMITDDCILIEKDGELLEQETDYTFHYPKLTIPNVDGDIYIMVIAENDIYSQLNMIGENETDCLLYSIDGRKVVNDNLMKGLYIVKKGSETQKLIIR